MRAIYFEKSIPRVVLTLALKPLWKGAPFSPLSPVQFRDLPEPPLPGPRWVRLKNRVCGICASDLHLVFVDVDPKVHPAALPDQSRLFLGHEVISDVVEVGEGVQTLAVGNRVLMKSRFLGPTCHSQEIEPPCPSCEAGQYAICQHQAAGKGPEGVGGGWGDGYICHESEVWQVPDAIDDESAALIEPIACGVRAVLRCIPKAGEKVLVVGCGMIGLGTLQALRVIAPDAEIYAAARYPQQIELAQSYGATVLTGKDLMAETARITGGEAYQGDFGNRTMLGGFDVIFDCVGNTATINQCLRLARAGGSVVLEGINLRPMKLDTSPIWHQEVALIGALAHGRERWQGEDIDTFALTARWIEEGALTTEGLVTHRYPLARWREAIQTAVDKRTGCVKVMLTP